MFLAPGFCPGVLFCRNKLKMKKMADCFARLKFLLIENL